MPFRLRHCLLLLTALAPLSHAEDLLFLDEGQSLPEVLTATRLQQAPAAVPGSITVIDRELIRASGARQLAEVLRLVPGMLVVPSGNLTNVNYHGSSASQARRLQVLVDGRSVYRAGLAQIDWNDIPIALQDIERIEVFRGPNTVSYGANALMAVVSIISRQPKDTHGTHLSLREGNRGISDWYASQGTGWESGDLRLSLSGMHDDGFDQRADGSDFRDDRDLQRLQLLIEQELAQGNTLEWQLALKDGVNQVNNNYSSIFPISTTAGQQSDDSDITARDYATSLRWNLDINPSHSLQIQSSLQRWERLRDWRVCDAQLSFSSDLRQMWSLSPEYTTRFLTSMLGGKPLPATGDPALGSLASNVYLQALASYNPATRTFASSCGRINEDVREDRFDIEIQDTLSLSDSLRLVSGLAFRHDRAESETYLNGAESKDIWRLFSQFEWHIDQHWLLQGGAMLEDDSVAGSSLSPRLALNYLITPAHGLRAVYSEAVRSPDMFENDANWQYLVRDLSPAPFGRTQSYGFTHAYGPGNLEQERMRSQELGYNGHFSSLGLSIDFKLFNDEITSLISEPLRLWSFYPSNDNWLKLHGAELEMNWYTTPGDRLRLTFANTGVEASNPLDETLTPRYSGSLGWMHDWGGNWSTALIYYGADELNGHRFDRVDLRVAREFRFNETRLELSGQLQQRLDDEPLGWPNNIYNDRHTIRLNAELDF